MKALMVPCLLLLSVMILSFTDMVHVVPSVLKGTVVSGLNKKPVVRAYVTAVSGEEEALTDAEGNFTLRTWQSLPVTITIQHSDYATSKLVIADTSHAQLIQLTER